MLGYAELASFQFKGNIKFNFLPSWLVSNLVALWILVLPIWQVSDLEAILIFADAGVRLVAILIFADLAGLRFSGKLETFCRVGVLRIMKE